MRQYHDIKRVVVPDARSAHRHGIPHPILLPVYDR